MRQFHEQLHELLTRVQEMGELSLSMVKTAVETLIRQDESLTKQVFATEDRVNALQVEVDDRAVRLTVLQQPVAQDARFLFMASRIGGELERIADQAINICQNAHYVLEASAAAPMKPLVELPLMAELAQKMVRDALSAMINKDPAVANRVLEEEKMVDAFKEAIFRTLLTYMMSDPRTIQRSLSLILISRNLERIGDHATNIAEEVIYWIQGRDVRHGGASHRGTTNTWISDDNGAAPTDDDARRGIIN
jgi:phosphate transport system protein